MTFGKALKSVRQGLGYHSGRSFFQFLEDRNAIDFNYSYYVRIESGKVLPSEGIVNSILGAIPSEERQRLLYSFCQDVFPKYKTFFPIASGGSKAGPSRSVSATSPTFEKQRFLTEKQIAVIGSDKAHYFLFLILILARHPVGILELKKLELSANLERDLEDLEEERLIAQEEGLVVSLSNEIKFPKAETATIRALYDRMNEWDREFSETRGFEELRNKMHLRRISPRYFDLIVNSIDLLSQLVLASEEVDTNLNEEVLQLSIRLHRGKLPG